LFQQKKHKKTLVQLKISGKTFVFIRLYFCPSQIHIYSFTGSQLHHSMTNSLHLTPLGFELLTNRCKRWNKYKLDILLCIVYYKWARYSTTI